MEIWKDIKGYEGLYIISNTGKVKGLKYNKLLKPVLQKRLLIYTSVQKFKKQSIFITQISSTTLYR